MASRPTPSLPLNGPGASTEGRRHEPEAAPRRLASVAILAWTVRLGAVINLIAFALHHPPKIIDWLGDWVPFEISADRRILMLLTAILLFILASGLERGKRTAWVLTLVALTAAPFIHIGRMVIWPQLLLNLPLICLLIINRRYFVARSNARSVGSAMILCPLLLLTLLASGTARLHHIRTETSGSDSWLGCLQTASELILVQNVRTQQPLTPEAQRTFSLLRIGGLSTSLLVLFLSLRPVSPPRKPLPDQLKRAAKLIESYSEDPVDAYALMGDKSLFFSSSGRVVIPFAMAGRFAVALADPIGPAYVKSEAIAEFSSYCRQHDWVPLFYQTLQDLIPIYRHGAFSVMKIGEDARLKTALFDLKGKDFQNLRTLCNHARKQGIRFQWYNPSIGPDESLEKQLAAISEEWVKRKKGVEMVFDMGVFSLEDIRAFGAGVALDAEGRVLAFTTWRPFSRNTGRVLDLMRSTLSARGVLDFVLVESILHFAREGVRDISLGNAPLAHAGSEHTESSTESRVVRFIYENLNLVYAYKPLFEFKRKYRPLWQARYLAYPSGESLPLIGLALVRVHAPRGTWRFFKPWKK